MSAPAPSRKSGKTARTRCKTHSRTCPAPSPAAAARVGTRPCAAAVAFAPEVARRPLGRRPHLLSHRRGNRFMSEREEYPELHGRLRPTFPEQRPRRLRRSETLRALVAETRLSPQQFIYPLFSSPAKAAATPSPLSRSVPLLSRHRGERGASRLGGRNPRGPPLRRTGREAPPRPLRLRPGRRGAPGRPGTQEGTPRINRHHRRLPLLLHHPRPLRRARCRGSH